MIKEVVFTLNGEPSTYGGSPATRLLDVLREELRNTGVKCGCLEGECGACSVIMDGVLVNSCMVAMGRAAGSKIVTIEGFRETRQYKALDEAFASAGAVQCGFCTPGMVMAAQCILSKNPRPDETEIRVGISGNLCRCTGYNAIVSAIAAAAKEGDDLW